MAQNTQITPWVDSGIVDRSGMAFWHSVVSAETGNSIVYDYSGNNRHASTAGDTVDSPVNNPAVVGDAINGEPAIYFDGTDTPLKAPAFTMTLYQIFILAKFDGAAFTGYNGIFSTAALPILFGNNTGSTVFFDNNYFEASGYIYRKNGTVYAEENLAAPMNEFALLELTFPTGFPVTTGIQYGRDRDFTARRWLGWFVDAMGFTSLRTDSQLARIRQYYRTKYDLADMPLAFPDAVNIQKNYARFYDKPLEWDEATKSHKYQDGGQSFNETGTVPPRRWEVIFNATTAQKTVFDAFNNAARRSRPFTFTDKFGTTWSDVYIQNYNRNHEGHKSWRHSVKFDLVKYP